MKIVGMCAQAVIFMSITSCVAVAFAAGSAFCIHKAPPAVFCVILKP